MRKGKNTLNNMMLGTLRKNQVYQAIITDLAITGNIDRDDAEMLLGYSIPSYLKTPDGQHLKDKDKSDEDENGDDESDEDENGDDESDEDENGDDESDEDDN